MKDETIIHFYVLRFIFHCRVFIRLHSQCSVAPKMRYFLNIMAASAPNVEKVHFLLNLKPPFANNLCCLKQCLDKLSFKCVFPKYSARQRKVFGFASHHVKSEIISVLFFYYYYLRFIFHYQATNRVSLQRWKYYISMTVGICDK